MTNKLQCPACGSDNVSSSTRDIELDVPFASAVRVSETVDVCGTCGSEGDFLGQNEPKIEDAIRQATRASVKGMIDSLAEQGTSMAYFERALGLPQRTMARWKMGECSSPAVALLRVVSTYPWILPVAESGFDYASAQMQLLDAAFEVLQGLARKREYQQPVAGQPSASVTVGSPGWDYQVAR